MHVARPATSGTTPDGWRPGNRSVRDDTYQAFLREGASFGVRVPLAGTPRHVKVVVYDYDADVLGTATATLEK